jgi:hypothetical protein
MPIELFGKIASLNPAYPQSGDGKRQGDDHIRGLKSALQATFPEADREFRIPRTIELIASKTIAITEDNRRFSCKTGSGTINLVLPVVPAEQGSFEVEIYKSSADSNPVLVSVSTGNINGYTSKIRINEIFTFHKFIWQGSAWHHVTSQPAPVPFDYPGGIIPTGYVRCNGQTLNPPSDFPDINLYYGGTTLPNSPSQIIRMA